MGGGREGETQMWAEAVKGTTCPRPRRGHVPAGGGRGQGHCPLSQDSSGGLRNPENSFTQW